MMDYSDSKDMNTLDIIVISVIAGIFLTYYSYYWYISHHPVYSTQTQLGRNLEMMILWSQLHAENLDPASVTLAVQVCLSVCDAGSTSLKKCIPLLIMS